MLKSQIPTSPSRAHRLGAGGLAAAVLAAAALSGCGSSGAKSNGEATKSATQIFSDAKAATGGASSARIDGSILQGGDTVALHIAAAPSSGGGTVTTGGATFDVVLQGSTLYLKGDSASWTKAANATVAQKVAGKWLKVPTSSSGFSDFSKVLELPKLMTVLTTTGTLGKGKQTTFHGQSAIPLVDHSKIGGTLYVATTGKPYILGVTKSGSDSGQLLFSDYGSADIPKAPSGAESLSQLAG